MSERSTHDELSEIARHLRTHVELLRDQGVRSLCLNVPTRVEATTPVRTEPAVVPSSVRTNLARKVESTPGPIPRALDTAVASFSTPTAQTPQAQPKTGRFDLLADIVAPRVESPSTASTPLLPMVELRRPSISAEPRTEGQARIEALAVMNEAVTACTRCRLSEKRNKTVFSRGSGFARLAFVGEGPGRDEDLQGRPFVGAAGQLLDRILGAMGMSENDVYIANVVKCRPPENRVPLPDEMKVCGPFLLRQLGLVRPEVIVALGRTAANYLLENDLSMSKLRGRWHSIDGIPLLATWHPAYLLRNPAAKGETWDDMKRVLERMGLPVPTKR